MKGPSKPLRWLAIGSVGLIAMMAIACAALYWQANAWLKQRIAADRVLQDGPVSAESRQALEEELAQRESMPGFIRSLKSERALGLDSLRAQLPRLPWIIDYACRYLA
jgi:hypothetical protein